jgi:hypothetical protein
VKSIVIAGLFAVLIGTAAQAEIMCTNHRGCFETGGRIFRSGGRMIPGMTITNHHDGQKDSGKLIRIKRVYRGNE